MPRKQSEQPLLLEQLSQFYKQSHAYQPEQLGSWISVQQKLWQDFWEYASWQQKAIQEDMLQGQRLLTHFCQASTHPKTFYRYLHMNWQKPYLTLNAQAITQARFMGRLMGDYWSLWQNALQSQKKSMH